MPKPVTKTQAPPKLILVVPCYNEAAVLQQTSKQLHNLLAQLIADHQVAASSSLLFVDDGSQDETWSLIRQLSQTPAVAGLKLSRNFGQQAALLAGLDHAVAAGADLAITLDADLQDDLRVIPTMLKQSRAGAAVVYGVRDSRQSDTPFKRLSANWFYRLMRILGIELVHDHADFRLLTRPALLALQQFGETHVFLRGLVPLLGFKSATVTYARQQRQAGESKYPLFKMLAFAADGLFSFSIAPIKLIGTLGALVIVISGAMIVYSLIQRALGHVEPGWSSLIVSIWFLGGVQLLSLRVIGEYLGRIFQQTKHRPRYLIEAST